MKTVLPVFLSVPLWVAVLFVPCGFGQEKKSPPNAASEKIRSREVFQILEENIDLNQAKYRDSQLTLREVLSFFQQDLEKKKLRIFVNQEAFREEGPDAPDVEETQIKFFPNQGSMPLITVLRRVIAKVPTGNAFFLVRRGHVEITTQTRGNPANLLREPVMGVFENVPLQDILQELADQTGATILLDPSVKDQGKTPITATLRGTIPLESAVRFLAGMADLRTVIEDDILLVTRKKLDRAEETGYEFHHRRLDSILEELRAKTGKTIILDPQVARTIRESNRGGKLFQPFAVLPDEEIAPVKSFTVTATFQKKTSVESMVRLLTAMVDLSAVMMEDAIYVTDTAGASRLQLEMETSSLRKKAVEGK